MAARMRSWSISTRNPATRTTETNDLLTVGSQVSWARASRLLGRARRHDTVPRGDRGSGLLSWHSSGLADQGDPLFANPLSVSRAVRGLGRSPRPFHCNLPMSMLVGVSHGCPPTGVDFG